MYLGGGVLVGGMMVGWVGVGVGWVGVGVGLGSGP